VEDERRRIARELHDVVSHAVTLIAVQAEAGQAVIERDWRAADRSLQAIGQASRDALGELDRMLGLLRLADAPSGDLGLRRLPALLDGARSAGMRIDVERSGTPFALRDAADLCAYRVIQEAITNALRHARGSTVTLGFGYGDDALELTIMSEGESHASAYGGTGRGLVGLDERVRSVGGTLSTTRDADRTFTVHARIPNDADRLRP
jgi:signal transduction histidine kinase